LAGKIQEHILVPEHSLVSEEDAEAFLNKLNAPKSKIPVILKDDPAIKKLKANTGDIIKIERKSHTAGKSIYYRVVK